MLRILLIEAQSNWFTKGGPRLLEPDFDIIIPPIGLIYIATYLKDKLKNNIQVKIIDLVADFLKSPNLEIGLEDILKEYNPDIVGIRGVNIFSEQFHETTKIIKELNEDVVVVGGGPYITMDLQGASKDKAIDYFVIGEGEITFTELVERLLNNQSVSDVKGLAYRDNGKLIINEPRPFIEDLDCLPFPDYSLISVDKYSRFLNYGFNRRRQAIILSSRGCPYSCIYCHNMFGRKFRARSAENIFEEIKILYNDFGIKDLYFIDDNFNLDYQRAIELFDLIINNGVKINIYFPNALRGDIIDRYFIDKMVEAGVICLFYAIETASARLQKFIKKFIDLDKLAENIHYTCEKGIMVGPIIMVGFPTETEEEALQTIEYLKQFKKVAMPVFHSVKYHPNTEIYDLALRNGFKLEDVRLKYRETYYDISYAGTPSIPRSTFISLHLKFQQDILFSKERLLNAIEIQEKFLTKQEILDFYSILFRKVITDLELDVLRYVK